MSLLNDAVSSSDNIALLLAIMASLCYSLLGVHDV
jgi:hypothetical protein